MRCRRHEPLDVESLAAEITASLRDLGSLKTESLRAIRREFSERIKTAAPQAVVQLAVRLLDHSTTVPRLVAYELVHYHHEALTSLRAKELEQLERGIDDWGAVDTFACYLSGPAWREGQVPDKLIHRWARSKDRWWRRAALVSTVPLNNKARGGRGDAQRTLEVCRLLMDDRDDMVVKAMSWALRELAKRDPKAVRWFLAEHEDALAARVVREVRNKLSTGLKNPRR
jgi:3-methyladenine DNA glycosylase AlkD